MSLEPLDKSFNKEKYKDYNKSYTLLGDIRKIVFQITNIDCDIKLTSANKLYLKTQDPVAATELRFYIDEITNSINNYLSSKNISKLTKVIIKTF